MPIHGYVGNIITANPTAPTVSAASGVWTTEQQLQAVSQGNWPGYEYPISRSLRFNAVDSTYLSFTFGTPTNQIKWTVSMWLKRGQIDRAHMIYGAYTGSGETFFAVFSPSTLDNYISNSATASVTNAVFRDPSAWYHVVQVFDSANATAADRFITYVNGVRQTTSSLSVTQNDTVGWNTSGQLGNIGRGATGGGYYGDDRDYFDGYLTEINFIDGQALTPSSFGLNDPETGVWSPKQYTGTYGTNGFYLNFSDNSGTTSTTLGKDSSGNGNNWTPNNFSVTAGAGNDSLVDTPTSYGTDTGAGGEVRGNYCTLNPLRNTASSHGTFSNGNLQLNGTYLSINCFGAGTMILAGKMYWEFTITTMATASTGGVGIVPAVSNQITNASAMSTGIYYLASGNKVVTGVSSAYGSSYTSGDVIGIAVDVSAETVTFYKNNVSQGSITGTGIIASGVIPYVGMDDVNSPSVTANFGQRPFAYTAPSGYKAVCTQNLPTPTIGATSTTQAGKYFNPVLYTGTGSSLSVTGVGFQPDFTWIKGRSGATDHGLYDAVRGVQKQLESNNTDAETTETTGLTAFGSDGFTVGALAQLNTNTATYVGWNWNAGGSNATNTSGSITSTVRANTTAGFSIVTYTGTGVNATVGHGLGVAPQMIITKWRTVATGYAWRVYHVSIGATKSINLNETQGAYTDSGASNNTEPTSSVFSIGTAGGVNTNTATYVAYCFAAVAGYSAFGKYTANNSTDGPFVYVGFRPRFVMWKNISSTGGWVMYDTARDTYNPMNAGVEGNLSSIEQSTWGPIDVLSNGFKFRAAVNSDTNYSSYEYIYAAFAESPFKYALAR